MNQRYYLYEVEKRKVSGGGYQQKFLMYHGRVGNVDNRLSTDTLKRVFLRDAFECCHCGSVEKLTVDHQLPLLDGGNNSMSNLHVLCFGCNVRKGRNVCACVLVGDDIKSEEEVVPVCVDCEHAWEYDQQKEDDLN